MKLTRIDQDILELLRAEAPLNPTTIGMRFGKNYSGASSWASKRMKKLMRAGKVERANGKFGYYKLKS